MLQIIACTPAVPQAPQCVLGDTITVRCLRLDRAGRYRDDAATPSITVREDYRAHASCKGAPRADRGPGNYLRPALLNGRGPGMQGERQRWPLADSVSRLAFKHGRRRPVSALEDVLSNSSVQFSPLPGANILELELCPSRRKHAPIYVMCPLDTVTVVNTLQHVRALQAGLMALKSVGVDGVMVDVWWGIVEAGGPGQYDWSAYLALVKMVHAVGLKLQAVMSFHGCGGNVNDTCLVSLPYWILQEAEGNPDVFYTDRQGVRNSEYLSLGVDNLPLFRGRTPLKCYRDFIESFRDTFAQYLGNTVAEVAVGLGPAGELRYPSYPEGDGRWRFPGIGEFQCYDKYMLANLQACACAAGHPKWGLGGPHDAGSYNQVPEASAFFHPHHGGWRSVYGDFFLSWYSQSLIAHGERVLAAATTVLAGTGVVVAAKLPGIHWWFRTWSHAAELTAGYFNTVEHDGYDEVVRMFARQRALLNFTCVEMGDGEQPPEALCSPEGLLLQVRQACARHRVPMSGENALPRYDPGAYQRIKYNIHRLDRPELPRMAAFTFLRMGQALFQTENWRSFVEFVRHMDDEEDGCPPFDDRVGVVVDRLRHVASALQLHS